MKLSKYIACICEGAAEQAIIERLLDANKLIFTYDDMIEGEVIRCRSAKKFEERYLRKGFDEKITVLRILDSRREKFKLSKKFSRLILLYCLKIISKLSISNFSSDGYRVDLLDT